jgi:hypothetical protein
MIYRQSTNNLGRFALIFPHHKGTRGTKNIILDLPGDPISELPRPQGGALHPPYPRSAFISAHRAEYSVGF